LTVVSFVTSPVARSIVAAWQNHESGEAAPSTSFPCLTEPGINAR
jgi:hypothetical protein